MRARQVADRCTDSLYGPFTGDYGHVYSWGAGLLTESAASEAEQLGGKVA